MRESQLGPFILFSVRSHTRTRTDFFMGCWVKRGSLLLKGNSSAGGTGVFC